MEGDVQVHGVPYGKDGSLVSDVYLIGLRLCQNSATYNQKVHRLGIKYLISA